MAARQKEKFSYDQAREHLITFFAQAEKHYTGMQLYLLPSFYG